MPAACLALMCGSRSLQGHATLYSLFAKAFFTHSSSRTAGRMLFNHNHIIHNIGQIDVSRFQYTHANADTFIHVIACSYSYMHVFCYVVYGVRVYVIYQKSSINQSIICICYVDQTNEQSDTHNNEQKQDSVAERCDASAESCYFAIVIVFL